MTLQEHPVWTPDFTMKKLYRQGTPLSEFPHPGCESSGAQMPDNLSLIYVACLLLHSSACWGGSDGNKKGLFGECYYVFPGLPGWLSR